MFALLGTSVAISAGADRSSYIDDIFLPHHYAAGKNGFHVRNILNRPTFELRHEGRRPELSVAIGWALSFWRVNSMRRNPRNSVDDLDAGAGQRAFESVTRSKTDAERLLRILLFVVGYH
jgi:hypothetical protein